MHQASAVGTGAVGTACHSQRYVTEDPAASNPSIPWSFPLSLVTHSEEDSCHATRSSLKSPGGEDLRTLLQSPRTKHSCQRPRELEVLSSSRWLQPPRLLVGNLRRQPEPQYVAQPVPDSGPTETTWDNKISVLGLSRVIVKQQQIRTTQVKEVPCAILQI